MAELNATATPDIEFGESTVTMSKERWQLAIESSWEIESLANALREVVKPNDDNSHLVIRGITARLKELATIIMRVDDTGEKTAVLGYDLRQEGQHPNAVAI